MPPLSEPPWEYLCQASRPSLQSFELTRLNHAANLHKEFMTLLHQWLEETAMAMLARWLLEHPTHLQHEPRPFLEQVDLESDPLLLAALALNAHALALGGPPRAPPKAIA